jgi:hypothetical protein
MSLPGSSGERPHAGHFSLLLIIDPATKKASKAPPQISNGNKGNRFWKVVSTPRKNTATHQRLFLLDFRVTSLRRWNSAMTSDSFIGPPNAKVERRGTA